MSKEPFNKRATIIVIGSFMAFIAYTTSGCAAFKPATTFQNEITTISASKALAEAVAEVYDNYDEPDEIHPFGVVGAVSKVEIWYIDNAVIRVFYFNGSAQSMHTGVK